MSKQIEALKLAEEIFSGMLHGTDWNNGTHANIYRPKFPEALAAIHEALAEQPAVLEDPHPPHRLCECTACLEYWTPLPDCDAFAAPDKPITKPVKKNTPYCKSVPMCAKPCGDESCVEPVKQEPVAAFEYELGVGSGYMQPVDAKAIRAEALEEAEKVAGTAHAQGLQSIREAIVAAIRGLK